MCVCGGGREGEGEELNVADAHLTPNRGGGVVSQGKQPLQVATKRRAKGEGRLREGPVSWHTSRQGRTGPAGSCRRVQQAGVGDGEIEQERKRCRGV